MKHKIHIGLDIDETLISAMRYGGLMDRPDDAEFYFECEPFKYALYKRPFLDEFLQYVTAHYNVFFYTRALQDYAQQIITFLGYPHLPLFHRGDCERIEEIVPYAKNKIVYHKKNLKNIAEKLRIPVHTIVFIDDVANETEITPIEQVIAIPEYDQEDDDFCLKIILNHFIESETVNEQLQYMKTLQFL
jgi:TFIIF-interacting CTD phosphatase-like protein